MIVRKNKCRYRSTESARIPPAFPGVPPYERIVLFLVPYGRCRAVPRQDDRILG